LIYSLFGQENIVNIVKFSPNGKLIVSAGINGVVRVYNAEEGAQINSIHISSFRLDSFEISPDSKKILIVDNDYAFRV